jgi:hypothetical protein
MLRVSCIRQRPDRLPEGRGLAAFCLRADVSLSPQAPVFSKSKAASGAVGPGCRCTVVAPLDLLLLPREPKPRTRIPEPWQRHRYARFSNPCRAEFRLQLFIRRRLFHQRKGNDDLLLSEVDVLERVALIVVRDWIGRLVWVRFAGPGTVGTGLIGFGPALKRSVMACALSGTKNAPDFYCS